MLHRRIQHFTEECRAIEKFQPAFCVRVQPADAGVCQVCAFRVCYQDVPSFAQDVAHVALVVLARLFGWQEVA